VNDFRRDLEWSHSQSDAPWWEEVYRHAFPDFSTMHDVRKDGWAQRGGIDRQVILSDGTVLKIDEKARRTDYPDFCLEYYSDVRRKTPGWLGKPLTCDYIAYAFVPSRTCYLLPYQLLRRAWWNHRSEWVAGYREIRAENNGYTTVSVAVPIPVVLNAITGAMTVRWSAASEAA
jgi:hypothetical protein